MPLHGILIEKTDFLKKEVREIKRFSQVQNLQCQQVPV